MLKGKQINIRPMCSEDLELFYTWNTEQEHLGPFMGAQMHYKETFMEHMKKMFTDQNVFEAIIEDKEGKPLGVINYRLPKYGNHGVELGMLIADASCRGKGIGKEALALFVDYIYNTKQIFRIQFETRVDNVGMRRIGEKVGFTVEGVLRGYLFDQGAYRDYYMLAITREDWLRRKESMK